MDKNSLTTAMAVLGACLIISTLFIAISFYNVKALSNNLTVTGSAEKVVMSDTVKWISNISRNVDANSLKAGSAQLKADIAILEDHFQKLGIKETEITINPPTISVLCENQNNVIWDKSGNQNCAGNRISGYSLQQTIIVESDRPKEITEISKEAGDQLIEKGLVFATQGVEYYYNKLGDLRLELLGEATKNAKERAEKIAKSTGKDIGFLQSASQGVFQVTAKNSTDVSDYGVYDTSSIEKKVISVVRASFVLK
ncbi:MAG TPA: SIMPL domain-containing protein [Candidatus Pacearchaeota archaeon]|nr:SIMPL domain-containing protein [Candidatus Parcubacteria bacterium]HNZ84152.1 SIMPL domain-containing protein [Candidatus Pacearchaeota archaeon]HOU45594.1 SIMPL domain-containing protein [Candidatus Pacearchaeota archaeon]HPM08552.1 SIMPL domain-containing protein [Candidatus Pacearchaeota archaeon]HQI74249.1 SIMPL domain-containing protein [Candidatus Pacearchaeota archaeon]